MKLVEAIDFTKAGTVLRSSGISIKYLNVKTFSLKSVQFGIVLGYEYSIKQAAILRTIAVSAGLSIKNLFSTNDFTNYTWLE
jgi:hypothetical protein